MDPQEKARLLKVRATRRSLIVPEIPTKHHWLDISNLDRVVNPTFVSALFFYENVFGDGKSTFSEVTASLKKSLAKVLVDFYPLAGRLAVLENGEVDLECNDAGAIFLEAFVNSDLQDIGAAQPMPMLSGLDTARLGPGPLYIPDQLTPMPVLVIQVTKFTCGSISVAVNWHHTIADGYSGCHFIQCWSEVATGRKISLQPDHDRSLLRPRSSLDPSLVNGYSTKNLDEMVTNRPRTVTLLESKKRVLVKSFHLQKQTVQNLRESVNMGLRVSSSSSQPDTRPFTTVEIVGAELWKLLTRARVNAHAADGPQGNNEISRFYMFVDGRKRMNLPPGYFGNVVCSTYAESTERDLLEKDVPFGASLIREAVRNVNNDYMRSLIDWVQLQRLSSERTFSGKSEHVISFGQDVGATFWNNFPLYEVDFGWGKPIVGLRNSPPRRLIDGIAMMPSPAGPGNMVALINLHTERMEQLEADPEFQSVSEPFDREILGK